jgi:hypothetical protein
MLSASSDAPFNFGQTLQFYLSVHPVARVYEHMGEAVLKKQEHCAKKKNMRGRPKMKPASKGPDTQIISPHEQG